MNFTDAAQKPLGDVRQFHRESRSQQRLTRSLSAGTPGERARSVPPTRSGFRRWLAAGSVVLVTMATAAGCALRQNAPVVPEIEPAGSAPPGSEPTDVDPFGDDAAERPR